MFLNNKQQIWLTGVLEADVRTFLFKDFFFSPSSIIREPDSISLSAALALGNCTASPVDKASFAVKNLDRQKIMHLFINFYIYFIKNNFNMKITLLPLIAAMSAKGLFLSFLSSCSSC